MTWTAKQSRWIKEYRGKHYSVSCKQLKTAKTKEASRQAANEWWLKKQEEIDGALGEAAKHPAHIITHYKDAIENWRLWGKWHRKYGDITQAEKADNTMEFLEEALKIDNPPFPLSKSLEDPRYELITTAKDQDGAYAIWLERFLTIRKEERNETSIPKENTIKAHAADYLALKKVHSENKGKIGSYFSNKQWLMVFINWLSPYAAITELNEGLWERYFIYLSSKVAKGDYTTTTAHNYFSSARAFIKNRYEKGIIPAPLNLHSRDLVFTKANNEIITFSIPEIKEIMALNMTDIQRLYILLALNCGMYFKDIATLEQGEVDWTAGRITRKRTKTRDRSTNVPKVDYLLWRETFTLLKKCKSADMTLVLLNDEGKPLYRDGENKKGNWKRDNNIKTSYDRLMKKLPKEKRKSWIKLRKTGATLLENSKSYGRYSEHYLGEAPHTIASRHYSHKNGEEFDNAIKWLGKELGIK